MAMMTRSSPMLTLARWREVGEGRDLKTYKGFPHGMPTTNADQINADLLEFHEVVNTHCSVPR